MCINDIGHYVQENNELIIFLKTHFYVCKETITLIRYNSARAKNSKEFVRFTTIEALKKHIESAKSYLQRNEDYKLERKEAKANTIRTAVIGDIFVSSWGWEQTNVDYYQVVELKGGKSYVLRQVGQKQYTAEGMSSMSCYVTPKYNSFYGDELFVGRITAENRINVNKRSATFKPYTLNDKQEREYSKDYCSWYG